MVFRIPKRLWLLALVLACIVVPLGAYVRLSDAGLGCPDWPGCYGRLSPHHAADAIRAAQAVNPDGPVSLDKAWKEMVHRYLAATLGLVILIAAVRAWWQRRGRAAATGLLLVVAVQGLLGMWTVTLLLKPAVVSAHLVGGMTVAALLAWGALSRTLPLQPVPATYRRAAWALVVMVALQILLGGWVSSNYAALACQGFPTCNGSWLPPDMRFDHAFHLVRDLGEGPDGTPLASANLVAIHWLHRVGALVVSLAVLGLLWTGWGDCCLRGRLVLLGLAWLLQVGLGIANVVLQLPLPVAVAHNAGALLLLSVAVLFAGRLVPVRVRQPLALWKVGRKAA